MANLFDYLDWRGDLTVEEAGINPVDGLILSCLSYVVLDHVEEKADFEKGITVERAAELFQPLTEEEKRLRDPKDEQLLTEMAGSHRFGQMKIRYYTKAFDREREEQFAALCVELGDGSYFLSFRGTDYTVAGWKEDFNMSFRTGVPAQQEAVRYLKDIAEQVEGPLYLGGHSKGGNLAAFAAAYAGDAIQERIVGVFNNDGPGFLEEVIQSEGYRNIYKKIGTFIPQASLVGILLEHEEDFIIIKSDQYSVMQHDPYSWEVMGPDFIYLKEVTKGSRFMNEAIHGWLSDVSVEQRERFVDAVFEVVNVNNAATLQEMVEAWIKNAGRIVKNLRDVDDETSEMIQNILTLLVENLVRSAQNLFLEEQEKRMEPFLEKLEQFRSSKQ